MQAQNVPLLRASLRQLLNKSAILWAATALVTSSRLAFLYVRNLIPIASKNYECRFQVGWKAQKNRLILASSTSMRAFHWPSYFCSPVPPTPQTSNSNSRYPIFSLAFFHIIIFMYAKLFYSKDTKLTDTSRIFSTRKDACGNVWNENFHLKLFRWQWSLLFSTGVTLDTVSYHWPVPLLNLHFYFPKRTANLPVTKKEKEQNTYFPKPFSASSLQQVHMYNLSYDYTNACI